MAEITVEDLMRRQRAMSDKAAKLVDEKDVGRIQEITRELEAEGRELEALARSFEKQELAKAGPPPRGSLEVVLTADQRERVAALTGVTLDSIIIADEAGVLSRAMPHTDPRDIELMAIEQARRIKAAQGADTQARAAIERAVKDIEEQGMGEVRQKIEELKQDPHWLGGILHKK
jgi:hypothetical protein